MSRKAGLFLPGRCLGLATLPAPGQQAPIDSLIRDRMQKQHIPGLAVAVLTNGEAGVKELAQEALAMMRAPSP